MKYTADAAFKHVLADGITVWIRLIRPEDAEELKRGFAELSPESRYRRFLTSTNELSDAMVRYFTNVDGEHHLALVAFVESPDLKFERGVGVGRFVRIDDQPEVAEAAITVVDDFQRRGLGKLMLTSLIEAAAERGVRKFRAEVLAANTPIRHLLHEVGGVEVASGDGTISYDVPIDTLKGHSQSVFRLLRAAASDVAVIFRQWWMDVRRGVEESFAQSKQDDETPSS